MPKSPPKALIALGGNLPFEGQSPRQTLELAIAALADAGLTPVSISRFYTTPCFPKGAGPDYVNASISLETDLPAPEILAILHQVEAAFSRTREQRWGMRTLDLDLLAVDNQIAPDLETFRHWMKLPQKKQTEIAPQQLILPHPRIQDRGFVLIPLRDVAPDWVHPVLQLSVAEMVAQLSPEEISEIVPI